MKALGAPAYLQPLLDAVAAGERPSISVSPRRRQVVSQRPRVVEESGVFQVDPLAPWRSE